MRIAAFLFFSSILFILPEPIFSAESHTFKMETPGEFRATFQRDFAKTSFQPHGVSNRCFKAILPENGKLYAVHSAKKMKAENVKALYISGFFKGKGKFRIGFILYGKDHKIFWLPPPGVYSPVMALDTQKWEKRSFTLLPFPQYAKNITGFLTAVVLLPGTELYMDDITVKNIRKDTTQQKKEAKK